MAAIADLLSDWFDSHGREFLWRNTDNSFHILLAEIMLRRTTSTHVDNIFEDFIAKYSTPESILHADEGEILEYLEPLGLQHQRYRTLMNVCSALICEYNGSVPTDASELMNIDGIGEYTANATLSFSQGQRHKIVDSNVIRIFSRLYDIDDRFAIEQKVEDVLPEKDHVKFNMALLDLGALICLPQYPKCHECPIVTECKTGNKILSDS